MAAIIAYTLPAMQLVCYLVTSGNSSNDVTNSATTQSPLQSKPTPLPDGYVANPDLGFAYKYHSTHLVWIKAQNVCIQEGARLAVIDSPQKIEYLAYHTKAVNSHIISGIIRAGDTWYNVNTGESVVQLVWESSFPSGTGDCIFFELTEPRNFRNDFCSLALTFFCEIPILPNSRITVN